MAYECYAQSVDHQIVLVSHSQVGVPSLLPRRSCQRRFGLDTADGSVMVKGAKPQWPF